MTLLTPLPSLGDLFDILHDVQAEYPEQLLQARRAAFVAQIHQRNADCCNPADCDDIETPPVSDEADERNSREFPY